MSLPDILESLPRELARLSSAYERTARVHRAFDPYPTLPTVLARLELKEGRASSPERNRFVTLLVGAHQRHPDSIWSTLLLHAFAGILLKLRQRLQGGDEETRDAVLVESSQEALSKLPTDDPARIFMYFRQELERRAFKAMEKVTAWEEVGFGTPADLEPDPSTVYEPPLIGIWLKGHGTRPEQAELLSTLVDRGGLTALVRRRHPELDAHEQNRVFRRIQQQRRRLVARLRKELEMEAPETRSRATKGDVHSRTDRHPAPSSAKPDPVSDRKPGHVASQIASRSSEEGRFLAPTPSALGLVLVKFPKEFCS